MSVKSITLAQITHCYWLELSNGKEVTAYIYNHNSMGAVNKDLIVTEPENGELSESEEKQIWDAVENFNGEKA